MYPSDADRLLNRFERARAAPRLMMLYPPVCTGETYVGRPEARDLWAEASGSATLYVHVPFCAARCGFCPFYAVVPRNGDCEDYVSALLAEAALYAPHVSHLRFTSVYFGGGTPTLLPPTLVERILDRLRGLMHLQGADVTLEGHPGTVDDVTLRNLRAAGMTRLSLGVQSFDPDVLNASGRGDTADLVRPSVEAAMNASLREVNIDLMYGLPAQSFDTWEADLDTAVRMGIPSLTLYATVYLPAFRERCESAGHEIAGDDDRATMYERAHEMLDASGYPQPHFGAGAFLRGEMNPHRRNVALGRPTLGLGTWAYSSTGTWAYHNRTPAAAWAAEIRNGRLPIHRIVQVEPAERARRHVIEALLLSYVDLAHFKATWGLDLSDAFPAELEVLEQLGLTTVEDGELRLTRTGARHQREIRYLFASPDVVDALESEQRQGL